MIRESMEKTKNGSGLSSNGRAEDSASRWLSEVKIQRFKAAFKPGPIPLSPFNVVIGRNGSGKSTLLEALQWLDVTIRRDAREACDRYYGIGDLINLRSQAEKPYFELTLTWSSESADDLPVRYEVRVENRDGTPVIAREELAALKGQRLKRFIHTSGGEKILVS